MLIEKIEEFRRLEGRNDGQSFEDQRILETAIEELENKRKQLEKGLKSQMDLKKKLEVIIKICDLNKMYGSETDYLSYYL